MLRLHRGELRADFRRYYGMSVAEARVRGLPLSEVADMAAHLPLESATQRALRPQWPHTHELELLRGMDYSLRWLQWAKTEAGSKNRNRPDPYRFPWEADPHPETIRGEVMTVDELDDFLGWTELKKG